MSRLVGDGNLKSQRLYSRVSRVVIESGFIYSTVMVVFTVILGTGMVCNLSLGRIYVPDPYLSLRMGRATYSSMSFLWLWALSQP